MVRPEDAVERLRARLENRADEDLRAEIDAKEVARALAARLRAQGATRVVLFGSLALGTFRARSDIDLAVAGLSERVLARLEREFAAVTDRAVDLLNLDISPPHMRRHVERFGREL
jgi:predicted nucleotidyltransferase